MFLLRPNCVAPAEPCTISIADSRTFFAAAAVFANAVAAGDMDYAIGCGVENMTRVPMFLDISLGREGVHGFEVLNPALFQKHELIHQGESAERIADKWGFSRHAVDEFAKESHRRAARAQQAGWNKEILPIEGVSPEAQKITLPCDIAGSFYPAADVDTFEFTAKKGETWWVEVASERLGLNTDPFVLVQRVMPDGKLTDVAELYDIAPPMKISSNGYSYDGPPYDAGSADPLGKVEIKEDGIYRLQVRDLFGGTRTDPSHVYRLIVRQAAPDFSLAAWALHMTLRNGDRAALSKPIALRGGATMAFEVVVVRKDGFTGAIDIGRVRGRAPSSHCPAVATVEDPYLWGTGTSSAAGIRSKVLFSPMGGAIWQGGADTFINKGVNGRWRDVLTPDDCAAYEAAAVEKLGGDCALWLAGGARA